MTKMSLKLWVWMFLCAMAGLSSAVDVLGSAVDNAELKAMLLELQEHLAEINSTLHSQTRVDAAQMCQSLGVGLASTTAPLPEDCTVILSNNASASSGVYTIQAPGETTSVDVYCDMVTAGGGWTLLQRRLDGSEDFYKSYAEYETGFGNLTGEHWIGNKHIHAITKQGKYELLVELLDFKQTYKYAMYSSFSVSDAASNYTLHVDGYNGTAGDSLKFDHDGHQFSADDRDNDGTNTVHCAQKHHGGYWYSSCFKSNLNGKWGVAGEQGIVWGSFKEWTMYVLKRTEMKIRRVK